MKYCTLFAINAGDCRKDNTEIMPKYRRNRINDAVARELSEILRDVKDPRISGAFVTVTGADVTGDLKYAKIFYSIIGESDEKELSKGLKSAAPFIRRELAVRLNLRQTPELAFVRDTGTRHGADIAELLHKIAEDRKSAADEPEVDDDEL